MFGNDESGQSFYIAHHRQLRADRALHFIEVHATIHAPLTWSDGVYLPLDVFIVLIVNLADEFLREILDSDHASKSAIFVDHTCQLVVCAVQVLQYIR